MGYKRNSSDINEGGKKMKKSEIIIPETSPIRPGDESSSDEEAEDLKYVWKGNIGNAQSICEDVEEPFPSPQQDVIARVDLNLPNCDIRRLIFNLKLIFEGLHTLKYHSIFCLTTLLLGVFTNYLQHVRQVAVSHPVGQVLKYLTTNSVVSGRICFTTRLHTTTHNHNSPCLGHLKAHFQAHLNVIL